MFNNVDFTGGFEGTSTGVTSIFGLNISPITHANRYGVFAIVAFVIAALIDANLRRSAAGAPGGAIRENERRLRLSVSPSSGPSSTRSPSPQRWPRSAASSSRSAAVPSSTRRSIPSTPSTPRRSRSSAGSAT